VDQHAVNTRSLQRLKRVAHTLLAVRPPGNQRHAPLGQGQRPHHFIGMHHHHHTGKIRKCRQSPLKNRHSTQQAPLLWHIAACAFAAACGNDDDCGLFVCHEI
jgi:hypothetical protein